MVKAWHYTHEPLGQQLCEGIRFFEFDMHIRSDAIMNYHLQVLNRMSPAYTESKYTYTHTHIYIYTNTHNYLNIYSLKLLHG